MTIITGTKLKEVIKKVINEEYDRQDIIDFKTINLQQEYDKLNKLLFNGELSRVPLKWNVSKRLLGHVQYLHSRAGFGFQINHLAISTFYDLPYSSFLNTLAHEMIHVKTILFANRGFISTRDVDDKHGYYFLKEAKRINDMGLGFSIAKLNSDPLQISSKSMKNAKTVIAFIIDLDGKQNIAVTSPSVYHAQLDQIFKIFQMAVNKRKYRKVIITYIESNNPKLMQLPEQRSFMSSIPYTPLTDELAGQLKGSKFINAVTITPDPSYNPPMSIVNRPKRRTYSW